MESAADSLELAIQQALVPLTRVADWVTNVRNYSLIAPEWEQRVKSWWTAVRF